MPESYWKKTLIDGSTETGTDSMIKNKLASWTKGRQDIISVELSFVGKTIILQCPPGEGEPDSWKQFDNFVFNPSTGSSVRLSREVHCTNNWLCASIEERPDGAYVFTLNDKKGIPSVDGNCFVCSIEIDGTVKYSWS